MPPNLFASLPRDQSLMSHQHVLVTDFISIFRIAESLFLSLLAIFVDSKKLQFAPSSLIDPLISFSFYLFCSRLRTSNCLAFSFFFFS